MLFGAGRSISALFTILIAGCEVRMGLNICYMKGRRGPLGNDTSFTTIIIVRRRMSARIRRVGEV